MIKFLTERNKLKAEGLHCSLSFVTPVLNMIKMTYMVSIGTHMGTHASLDYEGQAHNGDKSLRDILYSTLQYVRFASMNQNDLIKEVMPKKILSSSEVTDLLLAISSNLPWECPGLCKNPNQRDFYDGFVKDNGLQKNLAFNEICSFTHDKQPCPVYGAGYNISLTNISVYKKSSALSIETSKAIELRSVTFQSRPIAKEENHFMYNLSCTVTICKNIKGFSKGSRVLQVGGVVFCDNEIEFPLKLRTGQFLNLEAGCSYYIGFEFTSEHPVYTLKSNAGYDQTYAQFKAEGFTIKALTDLHLKQISYAM